MNKTKEILLDSIKEHQEAIDKAKEQLAKLETTYSKGDRFVYQRYGSGTGKALLVQVGCGQMQIVSLFDGNRYYDEVVEVFDSNRITPEEFARITDGNNGRFTRYWDNRRQCKV